MVDYAVDVTDDELSHHEFINAFLASRGEEPVNLDQFKTIDPPHVLNELAEQADAAVSGR